MIRGRAIKLSLDEGLPTEFRLFVPGWNETENGRFLFDDKAAAAVLSAYEAWGVDLSIDLEHQMLEVEPGETPDPTARDARGWCQLELRNGELWAVNVKWTPDGATRLTNKTQRYISPAFEADPKTKRVLKMINVAITAMPATHNTPALVAASARGNGMDPNLVKQALEAIEKGDAKAALDILKGLVASAAGADPDDGDGTGDGGSEGDGAEGVAPPAETEAVEDPKVVENADAPPPSSKGGSGGSSDGDDDDDDSPAKKTARKAALSLLRRLTGKSTLLEAVSEVETFRASHMTLETERQKLAKERAILESAERRKLCVELIQLGAEFPATVWADSTAKQPSKLKDRWVKMPIETLRAHAAEQRAARGGKRPDAIRPPPGNASPNAGDTSVTLDDGTVVALSANEVRYAKEAGAELKDYATLKRTRDSKKAGN